MSIFYKSQRVGKNEKPFIMYKFRTLKENTDKISSFANEEQYTWCGRFLRKVKLDELPQLWNLIRRDINFVGPRPEEQRTIDVLPNDIKTILLSRRPGLTSLASLHFFDETNILEESPEQHRDYWTKIKPMKILLDVFYINNRNLLLDLWIILKTISLIIRSFFTKY